MAAPLPYEEFKTEADQKGYKFVLGPDGNVVLRHRKSAPIDLAFERRAKNSEQVSVIKAALTTPDLLKNRVQRMGSESRLERINSYLNDLRDKYVTPAAEATGGFVGKHSWLGYLPHSEEVGRYLGKEAVETAVPNSVTGKAVGASMLLNPDELALRLAYPTLAGGAAGWASGEGAGQGELQGLGAGVAGELPHLPNTLNKARRLGRAERTKIFFDDKVPGDKVSSILHLPTFDELRQRMGNWVLALKDKRVQDAAGERYAEGMENIVDSIRAVTLNRVRGIKQAFMEKLHVPLNPRARRGYTEEMYKDWEAAQVAREAALTKGADLIKGMRQARKMRREVFDARGKPRNNAMIPSTKFDGKTPLEMLSQITGEVRQGLDDFHPALGNTYDAVNNEYKTFSAFRDIANIPDSVERRSGHVNLDAINYELATNPKPYQSRIGDDDTWDSVKELFRRHSPEAPNYLAGESRFDQPGELHKLRTIMYGTKGHMAATAESVGSLAGGAPLTARPVGEVPGLIHAVRQAATKPLRIPRLVAGEMENKKEEK